MASGSVWRWLAASASPHICNATHRLWRGGHEAAGCHRPWALIPIWVTPLRKTGGIYRSVSFLLSLTSKQKCDSSESYSSKDETISPCRPSSFASRRFVLSYTYLYYFWCILINWPSVFFWKLHTLITTTAKIGIYLLTSKHSFIFINVTHRSRPLVFPLKAWSGFQPTRGVSISVWQSNRENDCTRYIIPVMWWVQNKHLSETVSWFRLEMPAIAEGLGLCNNRGTYSSGSIMSRTLSISHGGSSAI